jgi:hypothetical protein
MFLDSMLRHAEADAQPFNLLTAMAAANAPIAKVFAVVAQQAEVALAQARPRPLHHLLRRIACLRVPNN